MKNYDPVYEYNKNIELYMMHYNPQDLDLFYLNFQLFRFFKEYSELEVRNIPNFRRPYMKGKIIQHVTSIGRKGTEEGEEEGLALTIDLSLAKGKEFPSVNYFDQYMKLAGVFRQTQEKVEFLRIQKRSIKNKKMDLLEYIGILNELRQIEILGARNLQSHPHEELNINIKTNKQTFINYFVEILEERSNYLASLQPKEPVYDFQIEEEEKNQPIQLDI